MSRTKMVAIVFTLMLVVAFSGCVSSQEALKIILVTSSDIGVEITLNKPYLLGRYCLDHVNVYEDDPVFYSYPVFSPLPNTLTFDNRWVNNPWKFYIECLEQFKQYATIHVDIYLVGPMGSFVLSTSFIA